MELNHNCGTYFEDPLNSYLLRPQDPKCKRTFLGGKTDIINKLIWRSESDCYIADCERFSSLLSHLLNIIYVPFCKKCTKLKPTITKILELARLKVFEDLISKYEYLYCHDRK